MLDKNFIFGLFSSSQISLPLSRSLLAVIPILFRQSFHFSVYYRRHHHHFGRHRMDSSLSTVCVYLCARISSILYSFSFLLPWPHSGVLLKMQCMWSLLNCIRSLKEKIEIKTQNNNKEYMWYEMMCPSMWSLIAFYHLCLSQFFSLFAMLLFSMLHCCCNDVRKFLQKYF